MDMDVAQSLLTEPKSDEDEGVASLAKEAYRRLLADTMLQGQTHILSFLNNPPAPVDLLPDIPSSTQSAERTLDALDKIDGYYLNLLDWRSANVSSIALNNTIYLWNAANGSTSELVAIDDDLGPLTSVSWAPDGQHVAIGLNSSDVQLWDSTSNKLVRTLRGIYQSWVRSLESNNHTLTTGGMDSAIVKNDVRA